MFDQLKAYCQKTLPFSGAELDLIDTYFVAKTLKKREFLFQEGAICDFLAYIAEGCVRHFYVREGVEKTCDLAFENDWTTDFQSFTSDSPGLMNLQAMQATTVFLIRKPDLLALYQQCPVYETFGRLMTERITLRATAIGMSLSAEKPEERFQNLLKEKPDILQIVPQRYVASYLGIEPESLSRLRKRIYEKQKP